MVGNALVVSSSTLVSIFLSFVSFPTFCILLAAVLNSLFHVHLGLSTAVLISLFQAHLSLSSCWKLVLLFISLLPLLYYLNRFSWIVVFKHVISDFFEDFILNFVHFGFTVNISHESHSCAQWPALFSSAHDRWLASICHNRLYYSTYHLSFYFFWNIFWNFFAQEQCFYDIVKSFRFIYSFTGFVLRSPWVIIVPSHLNLCTCFTTSLSIFILWIFLCNLVLSSFILMFHLCNFMWRVLKFLCRSFSDFLKTTMSFAYANFGIRIICIF